jgi:hypothetical protein
MSTTTAPRLALVLSREEINDRNLRHSKMRAQFRDLGFGSVSEAQEFSDSLAAHANGEPVSPQFAAGLAAAEKARAEQATRDAAAAASWSAQQRHVAIVDARDRAAQRLAICRGTAAYVSTLKAEIVGVDFGRAQDPSDILACGSRLAALAAVEAHLSSVAIPTLAGEAAAAQQALDALTKAPTASTKASNRN